MKEILNWETKIDLIGGNETAFLRFGCWTYGSGSSLWVELRYARPMFYNFIRLNSSTLLFFFEHSTLNFFLLWPFTIIFVKNPLSQSRVDMWHFNNIIF